MVNADIVCQYHVILIIIINFFICILEWIKQIMLKTNHVNKFIIQLLL